VNSVSSEGTVHIENPAVGAKAHGVIAETGHPIYFGWHFFCPKSKEVLL
jgi:hypothetical protein